MTGEARHGRLRPLLSGVVLRSQSDARLSALATQGHEAAFTTIFERYERELRAHAARVVRSARVDDVVAHTMLSAWSALLTGPPVEDLRPWLHRIVHNAALNTVTRRGYSDAELETAVLSPTLTEDLVEGRLAAGAALAAIAALPHAQRHALTLTAIEGRSAREAAAEMDLSESATRQLVYRARSRVRSAVSAITPLPVLLSAAGGGGGGAAVAGGGALGGFAGIAGTVKAAGLVVIATGTIGAAAELHAARHHPHAAHVGRAVQVATPIHLNASAAALVAAAPITVALPGAASARRRSHTPSGRSQSSPAATGDAGDGGAGGTQTDSPSIGSAAGSSSGDVTHGDAVGQGTTALAADTQTTGGAPEATVPSTDGPTTDAPDGQLAAPLPGPGTDTSPSGAISQP